MKVFISWSGEQSHAVALTFREWLPKVIQALEPWVSSEDIWKGQHWSLALAEELANTKAAVFCVTRHNLTSTWMHYEAGALDKFLDARPIPLLFEMKDSDLSGPFTQIQYATFEASSTKNREEMLKVLRSLNNAVSPPLLNDGLLLESMEMRWTSLEERLLEISRTYGEQEARKTERAQATREELVLEELLSIARDQRRQNADIQLAIDRLRSDFQRVRRRGSLYWAPLPPDLPDTLSPEIKEAARQVFQDTQIALTKALGRTPTFAEIVGSIDFHPESFPTQASQRAQDLMDQVDFGAGVTPSEDESTI